MEVRVLEESALRQLKVKLDVHQSLHHRLQVFQVLLLILRKDNDIVEVHHAHNVHETREGLMDVRLERCWGVSETERHNRVLELTVLSPERRLLLIILRNPDPIVRISSV